jgi:RND family efflux transporter MFP subunit
MHAPLPSAPRRLAIASLLCLAAAALSGCPKKTGGEEESAAPVAVHCMAAARAGVEETLSLRGRTATPPGGDLPVASQVAARVVEIRAREGDRVTRGAVIATVDDLAPRAAAAQAGASLARAKAADTAAQSALARARDLQARGITSKKDVEDAVARAEAARADLDAEGAAVRLASGTLGRVEVRSSFDGVVTRVWRGPGALVDGTAATPILQLAAADAVELVAEATERELNLVREGQKAEITLAAGGPKLAGSVVARARALDPTTGLGTVRVRVEGPLDADEKSDGGKQGSAAPPLGAFGSVTIALGRREGAMMIPVSALRGAAADGAEVAVCKGDKVEIRAVSTGYRDARSVEIVSGLEPGQKVAIDHVLGLDEETKIAEAKPEADGGGEGAEGEKKGDHGEDEKK